MTSPNNWKLETPEESRRDILCHGVQIAFGRLYATGMYGNYPHETLEVARQAAFHLIDKAYEQGGGIAHETE
jgi:hypothetical protein